jgi:hypothetical protein
MEELENVKGFFDDVTIKDKEIDDRLRDNIQDNSDVKNKILDIIKKFSFNN